MARRSSAEKRARYAGRIVAAEVRQGRSDSADAFIRDPESGGRRSRDDLADTLGREFVKAATTGEDMADEDLEQEVPEEVGGPFVESDASREFDPRPDESNPPDSTKEALPTAMGSGPPTPTDLEEAEESEERERAGSPSERK